MFNTNHICIQVLQKDCKYSVIEVKNHEIIKHDNNSLIETPHKCKNIILFFNGVEAHYFIRELQFGSNYRACFIRKFHTNVHNVIITLQLLPTKQQIIDYKWNRRLQYLIAEKSELEYALSWLSTLGGAFSALGDYQSICAEIAGKISMNQLKLALRLGDPNIASRSRLYLALSLIQRRKFKLAQLIVRQEYENAKNCVVLDVRLINMCKGIWSKLCYEKANNYCTGEHIQL